MRKPVEIDSEEDGPVIARAAAIDVAKATGMVCTRVPHASKPDRKVTKVWEVDATTDAIMEPAGYLAGLGIERVVLEATPDYRRLLAVLALPAVRGGAGVLAGEAGVAGRRRPCVRAVKVEDGPVELVRESSEQGALAYSTRPGKITTGSSRMR